MGTWKEDSIGFKSGLHNTVELYDSTGYLTVSIGSVCSDFKKPLYLYDIIYLFIVNL